MSAPSPLVSAIIPSWNRKEDLLRCIASIRAQDYGEVEIVVFDDASQDDTVATVRARDPDVRIEGDTLRCGHFYRRNQGIVASRGRYLLHLDSDVEFQAPGIISRMVARFESDATLGELGGEIPVHAGVADRAIGLVLTRGGYTRQVSVTRAGGIPLECDVLPTLNCMTRRDAVLRMRGFDPYYEFGMGDVDFGLAIKRLGLRNVLDFDCAVHHHASRGGRRPDVIYRYCIGRIRLLLKHRGLARTTLHFAWDMLQVLRLMARLRLGGGAGEGVDELQRDGVRFIPRAYAWHIRHLPATLRARGLDFLSPAEMKRFRDTKERAARAV